MVHPAPADLKKQWPGLETVGVIFRKRTLNNGKETGGTTVFISSRPAKVGEHVKFLRSHWGVENELHYTLDVTFKEDSPQSAKEAARKSVQDFGDSHCPP